MNRYILCAILTTSLCLLFSDRLLSGEFTEKEWSEFLDNIGGEVYMRAIEKVSAWPTSKEKKELIAKEEDIEKPVFFFKKYAEFLLNDEYLPDNMGKHVYGLYKWPRTNGDTLFAEWNIDGVNIKILDESSTYQVRIESDAFPDKIKNRREFIETVLKKYFKEADNILKYKKMHASHNTKLGITRISVRMPGNFVSSEQYPWVCNNPPMWYYKKTFVLVLLKKWQCLDSHDLYDEHGRVREGAEYAMNQRFPSLRKFLKDTSTEELAERYVKENNPAEKLAILRIICHRDDVSLAIDPLFSEWQKNKTLEGARALRSIMRDSNDLEKIKDFKLLIDKEIEKKPRYNLHGSLEKISQTLEERIDKLSSNSN